MKKSILMKSIFLLCLLLAGAVSAHADGYDYDCEKITDLSKVTDDETVLLVDKSRGLALSPRGETYGLKGVEIAIGEDNVIRNMPANIIWTIENRGYNSFSLKNNDDYLWGSLSTYSVSMSSSSTDATNVFKLDYNYGADSGNLYYEGNQGPAYFSWSANEDNMIVIGDNTETSFTLYKVTIKNYVKWKRVDGLNGTSQNLKVPLKNNDIVVVVDLKTGKAMSNDKGEKDPAGVAVTLNYDKDRIIMDEVPENVQWKYQYNSGNTLVTLDETPQQLYTDADKGLKVGNITEATNPISTFTFIKTDNAFFPAFVIDETDYQPNFEDGMFSNSWTLEKVADYHGDGVAIFKKVEDPQKVVKIELPEYCNYDLNTNYILDEYDFTKKVTITGAEKSDINWSSSKSAATINQQGTVTPVERGSTVITASVNENDYHDKASAKCTVIVDDNSEAELGSLNHPLTVAEAKDLAEKGKVEHDGTVMLEWEEGVHYYIKGKVSKVNSGMMAMFGDMDFGEMMGSMGGGTGTGGGGTSSFNFEDSMDDMDFDMEDMEDSGFDMSSMGFDMSSLGFDMSAMFGTSDKVTYYISDDGTKDGQMKVVNGCGTLKGSTGTMEFNPIPKLSAGDCVVVCGPLVYTEDTNMFSSMMGGNNNNDPKMSGKVDEMNYLVVYDPTLLITQPEQKEIYVNKTLDGRRNATTPLYTIDNVFEDSYPELNVNKFPEGVEIQPATYKSSDEDIAKWDDQTNLITGVNEGKAKITVKVKVIVVKDDPSTEDKNEEKSYTMKRKFKVTVLPRGIDPAGYYDGEWKLTTKTEDLKEGTRLVLVGTRVKVDKETADETLTDYMMVENNAMMGGGKNGSKIEFEDSNKKTIPSSTVINKKGLEVVLEQAEDGTSWYLNVGTDENDTPLYLYASVKKESSNNQNQQSGGTGGTGSTGGTGGTGGFNMDEMMEMFNPSSGLKVGTKAETASDVAGVDSLKATITIADNIATIKFPAVPDDKNNTIMLSSSFDMEDMMGMFGGNNSGGGNSSSSSSFDMGSFDMFMASFNTKKPGDEQAKEDEETHETKAPKCFMPRIYRFVPNTSYNITIGSTEWKTIVSYKDVQVPENVEAYIVTKVTPEETQSVASLKPVKELKGGEPYLLHYTSKADNYTMTLLTPNAPDELEAPKGNLLLKSDRKTAGTKDGSTVYVLANKSLGVGFYRWTGDDLGAGRVYLPVGATVAGAHEYCGFIEDGTTAILSIDDFKANVGPFYDLQGRRVDNPTKGIYIVNGKKVIVK